MAGFRVVFITLRHPSLINLNTNNNLRDKRVINLEIRKWLGGVACVCVCVWGEGEGGRRKKKKEALLLVLVLI